MELQSGPPGPLSDSSISETEIVAREVETLSHLDHRGAPEARPDQAFRSQLEPQQLVFYDELVPYDQSRYRTVPAERRDEWQDFFDYQNGGDDEY